MFTVSTCCNNIIKEFSQAAKLLVQMDKSGGEEQFGTPCCLVNSPRDPIGSAVTLHGMDKQLSVKAAILLQVV